MAVCAEVQGVAVLLSARIAAAQLKVHFLPLQVAFIRHHQALSNLQKEQTEFKEGQENTSEYPRYTYYAGKNSVLIAHMHMVYTR